MRWAGAGGCFSSFQSALFSFKGLGEENFLVGVMYNILSVLLIFHFSTFYIKLLELNGDYRWFLEMCFPSSFNFIKSHHTYCKRILKSHHTNFPNAGNHFSVYIFRMIPLCWNLSLTRLSLKKTENIFIISTWAWAWTRR